MDFVTFDNYLNYPRETAYGIYRDEKNLKILKVVLTILMPVFLLVTLILFFDNKPAAFTTAVLISIGNFLFITFLRIFYKRIFSLSNIRKFLYGFFILQLLIIIAINFTPQHNKGSLTDKRQKPLGQSITPQADSVKADSTVTVRLNTGEEDTFNGIVFFFAAALLMFRFSRNEFLQLYLIGGALPVMLDLFSKGSLTTGYIPNIIMLVIFFIIAVTAEHKRHKKFIDRYDFHYGRNYESIRMKRELDSARQIQLSMLPEKEAKLGDLEISGISIPANEVGGDYFDYFSLGDEKTGIFICDVSGHGVGSALLLSGLRSCMHLILEETDNPYIVIEKLNKVVRKTQHRKMFVTAIFAVIDSKNNKCELYNAGHLPPYKISGETGEIFKIKQHGITLGALEKMTPENNSTRVVFDFNKNDKLVLYTDGVNEAINNYKQEYGFENIENVINGNTDKEPGEILQKLIDDINKFAGSTPQRDDITILTIGRN